MQDKTNISTGTQAEGFVSGLLASKGAWVGDFNKGNSGSQPFDQIAITNKFVFCYDVKHCKEDRFDFSRVEYNQTLSLTFISEIDNPMVIEGFALVYEDEVYFLSWYQYQMLLAETRKSVKVSTLPLLKEVF